MSNSTANVNPLNIVLSPMRVEANGVDIGGTTESVKIGVKYKMANITVDQYGSTVIGARVAGQEYTCKFTLAESKDKSKWALAIPQGKLIGTAPNQAFLLDMEVGDVVESHATPWLFHPLSNSDADLSGDITLYNAACTSAVEVTYGPDKQVGLAVELIIFPQVGSIPAKFMFLGDPSIGIVNAVAGSPTPGGSNVGNGTFSSVTVYNESTLTETITVLCVGATSGNNFYVSGSLSGPLGEFFLAASSASTVNFSANEVSFTLTQGSTQFAYGDTFTIATTASNYT